jgi:hypothetical protein
VLDRDRRREVAGALERVEARERERGLAVVLRGARRQVLGERLGEVDQVGAGVGLGGELDQGGIGRWPGRLRAPATMASPSW